MNPIEIKYSSKFSFFGLTLVILCTLLIGAFVIMLIYNYLKTPTTPFLIIILIALFGILLIYMLYHLLLLKKIIITREHLIVKSGIFNLSKQISWNSIEDIERKLIIGSMDSRRHIYGEELIIKTKNKRFIFSSIFYKDFQKLLFQIDKRLKSQLKRKMKSNYRKEKYTFLKEEREYDKLHDHYFGYIIISLIILLFILKYF